MIPANSASRQLLVPVVAFPFSIAVGLLILFLVHWRPRLIIHGIRLNDYLIVGAMLISITLLVLAVCANRNANYKVWQKALIWATYCICAANLLYPGALFANAGIKARDRTRLKTTMARMKDWAIAWETYYVRKHSYAPSDQQIPSANWDNISADQIIQMLRSQSINDGMIKKLVAKDSWGNGFQFCTLNEGQWYFIRSAGKGGEFEGLQYIRGYYDEGDLNADVVMGNGQFLRWMYGGSAPASHPSAVSHKPGTQDVVPDFSVGP